MRACVQGTQNDGFLASRIRRHELSVYCKSVVATLRVSYSSPAVEGFQCRPSTHSPGRLGPTSSGCTWNDCHMAVESLRLLLAQSTTKDYIRAENKLQSLSKLFILQVIMPQVCLFFLFLFSFFLKLRLKFYPQFRNANPEKL